MTRLALERLGQGWRLRLSGSWSLAAMPAVEDELRSLPAVLDGPVVCDWSGAEAPGIGPAWALLHRLAERNPGTSSPAGRGLERLSQHGARVLHGRHARDAGVAEW